ncbi:MAG: Rid family hydrolase [Pseudomonadota bacterium]
MSQHTYITAGDGLPQWSNPISHAVVANGMCFVSGQLSVNRQGEYVSGSVHDEAVRSFDNFFAALAAAGFAKQDIVFVDIAFQDLAMLESVNTLYVSLFPEHQRPARTIYQVAALPFGAKIKVMGTAVKSQDK